MKSSTFAFFSSSSSSSVSVPLTNGNSILKILVHSFPCESLFGGFCGVTFLTNPPEFRPWVDVEEMGTRALCRHLFYITESRTLSSSLFAFRRFP